MSDFIGHLKSIVADPIDPIYNTATLSQDEIADQIFSLAKCKGFFK